MNNTLDLSPIAQEIMPYSRFIGMQVHKTGEEYHFYLPFQEMLIGSTLLPALHGGLIGGFMESAATFFLYHHAGLPEIPKIVNFSLDYLRPGHASDLSATCTLTRQGTRIANLSISAWQSDANRPISVGRAHFLMPRTSV